MLGITNTAKVGRGGPAIARVIYGALGTKRDDAAQIGLQHMASIRRKPLHAREKILSLWSEPQPQGAVLYRSY